MAEQEFKRHIAYKLKIGDILGGKVILDEEKFKHLEVQDKKAVRINLIANIIDKFVQDGEKKFASLTLDDASGQIKVKTFGEDIVKFSDFERGDTILLIGLLRQWNDEVYIIPEIIKKKETTYLLLRKLELDLEKPKTLEKSEVTELKDNILEMIKKEEENGGAEIDSLKNKLNLSPGIINSEIKKLLEEGAIYEPRAGKHRYLG